MIDKVADLSHQLREVGLPVSIRRRGQKSFKNSLKSNLC